MSDPAAVAQAFAQHYYTTLQTGPANLAGLYVNTNKYFDKPSVNDFNNF